MTLAFQHLFIIDWNLLKNTNLKIGFAKINNFE